MRVLHVIPSLDPASGGPPAVVTRLAAAQAAFGHDVAIVSHARPSQEAVIAASVEGIPGMDKVRVSLLAPAGSLWIPRPAVRALRALVQDADVVHIHAIWTATQRVAAAAAYRSRIPYVVAPHGMLYPWSLARKSLKKRLALALVERRMLNRAAALHCLNADEQAALQPLRLRPPVVLLPNGVFLDELQPLPQSGSFRAQHPELGGHPFVLFLSRLHPGKGLQLLGDAFAVVARQNPEARLVVAGPDAGAQPAFEAQVRRTGLQNRVHLVGPLYGRQKLAALADATCFCLPSEHETFSMAVTEALAFGVPAIITENCHFPEVSESAAGVVVRPCVSELAEALSRVLADASLRERLSRAGQRLIAERFTWPLIAEASLQAYNALQRTSPCHAGASVPFTR